MTREEAITYGKRVIDLCLNDETQAFCELAVEALKQIEQIEQIINSPIYIQEDVLRYKMIVEALRGEQK